MELVPLRDLIQDEYGNYYVITKVEDNSITITNFIVHSTYNRILNDDFFQEVTKKYGKSARVGKYFTDILKYRIELLETKKVPGSIYQLNEVLKYYEVKNIPLYERK